jgi:PEP-CTERM motif-containing protein
VARADNGFSHLQLGFSAGTYSLSIMGDAAGGLPAGFAFRLDPGTLTVSAVPEPSTWAMMILGFAGVGFMRTAGTRRFAWICLIFAQIA